MNQKVMFGKPQDDAMLSKTLGDPKHWNGPLGDANLVRNESLGSWNVEYYSLFVLNSLW